MTSIGKLNASLINASPELSLSLAQLNFDFSIIKLEAPLSYHGLGACLSTKRRNIAEYGSPHITARKLAALFEGVIPNTPKLVEAYGTRASEIAEVDAARANLTNRASSMFDEYKGVDGTSIWAAATSGRAAVPIHLLACMLARVFSPSEAVSIWWDLVTSRRQEIEKGNDHEFVPVASHFASQISVSMEQLAEWDNSARAWIRRGDDVKKRQRVQQILIYNNLDVPVSVKAETYPNVLQGWTEALLGIENLLCGQSQKVQGGSLLLALSSWHLYPDMIVLGEKIVKQEDSLFPPGAKIILGLQNSPAQQARGVYWCLSLSHYRFYGEPKETKQILHLESSRLSIDQLVFVALGSILSGWTSDPMVKRDSSAACRAFCLLAATLEPLIHGSSWVKHLAAAAARFLISKDATRDLYLSLMTWGMGRGSVLLGPNANHPLPLFSLTQPERFLPALSSAENRLALLRTEAARHFPSAPSWQVLIRYDPDATPEMKSQPAYPASPEMVQDITVAVEIPSVTLAPSEDTAQVPDKDVDSRTESPLDGLKPPPPSKYEYASALPFVCTLTGVEDGCPTGVGSLHHKRWMSKRRLASWRLARQMEKSKPSRKSGASEDSGPQRSNKRRKLSSGAGMPLETPIIIEPVLEEPEPFSPVSSWATTENQFSGEDCVEEFAAGTESIQGSGDSFTITWTDQPNDAETTGDGDYPSEPQKYVFFMGDLDGAAIFVEEEALKEYEQTARLPFWARGTPAKKRVLPISEINKAIEKDLVNPAQLYRSLRSLVKDGKSGVWEYFLSLAGLSSVCDLYEKLDDATINPTITALPLSRAKWLVDRKFVNNNPLHSIHLKRDHVLACVSYLDSAQDIALHYFKNVMAVSSGDSIYVAAALLDDPLELHPLNGVRRIVGNVGKPGLVLLVPPPNPVHRKPKAEDWRIYNSRQSYDGRPADWFEGTSLSLSFTDWHVAVEVDQRDQSHRTSEAELHEAVVSVHSRGQWIADVDILDALAKSSASWDHEWYYKHDCAHKGSSRHEPAEEDVRTITTWDEFLDNPEEPVIMLTHGNWKARLAAVALGVRRHDRVVATKGMCWDCWRDLASVGGPEIMKKAVFII